MDELGVVRHALEPEDVEVLLGEGANRSPAGYPVAAADGRQLIRIEPEGAGAREDGADLGRDPARVEGAAQVLGPVPVALRE